jgi:GNAT superfamily N-acetyltransferase
MPCHYAPLTLDDKPAILEHLLTLAPDDRVLRFNTTAPDNAVIAYCGRWNFAGDIVEGARDGEQLVGVLHLPVFKAGKDLVGELGVSVDAGWRKHGIATKLVARTVDRSRSLGLDRIYINFLTRNRPMACVARRFTNDIVIDGDETVAVIRLAATKVGVERAASAMVA